MADTINEYEQRHARILVTKSLTALKRCAMLSEIFWTTHNYIFGKYNKLGENQILVWKQFHAVNRPSGTSQQEYQIRSDKKHF